MATAEQQQNGRRDSVSDVIGIIPPRKDSFTDAPFAKRARGGSISGRLRAASDLAEFGMIDMSQKGMIKDLIISGDPALKYALDKYEKGDFTELDAIIKRGNMNRKQSIDLLEGLDFDFLNVNKFLGDMGTGGVNGFDELFGEGGFGASDGIFDLKARSDTEIFNMLVDDSTSRSSAKSNKFTSSSSGSSGIVGSVSEDGMIDMSMYARKAASLQPSPKKGMGPNGIKIRAPSCTNSNSAATSSRPPVVPRNDNQSSVDNGGQQALYGNMDMNGVPIAQRVGATSTYPFMISQQQMMAAHHIGNSMMHGIASTHGQIQYADGTAVGQEGFIGAYSPESRRKRIEKFLEKRSRRVWTKKVKYDVRKNFADSRLRVKGRFVKKEDEEVLRLQDML